MRPPRNSFRTIESASLPFLFATLLAAVTALAGCAGEEPADDAESAVTAEAPAEAEMEGENPWFDAADLCALIPMTAVAEAVGGVEPFRTESSESAPASCRYFFDVPYQTGARQASATVQMLSGYELERTGAGDRALDVTGVGDDAWATSHTDTFVLYTRRDNLVFSVNVAGGDDTRWPEMARAIAEVVFTHL